MVERDSARLRTSSPTVGSSSNSRRGSWVSARASLDPAALPARELPHLVAASLGEVRHAPIPPRCEARRAASRQAVQRGVVEQVLLDAWVEFERRLLKDDADSEPARQSGSTPLSWPNTRIVPLRAVIQPSDQRKQRRLAGAVQPEQNGETAGGHREGDIIEHPLPAKAVADPLDRQGRCGPRGDRRGSFGDAHVTAPRMRSRVSDRPAPAWSRGTCRSGPRPPRR